MLDSICGKISKSSLILLATVLSGAVNAEVIFATDTAPNPTTTAAVTLVPFDSIGRLKPQNTIGILSSNLIFTDGFETLAPENIPPIADAGPDRIRLKGAHLRPTGN
ncbi:MAG: hypothetical protein L3J24_08965, partial [Xanthomonadales bacterium]|nr:hypothetical protein [Xanthomonadales bacterium]